MEKQSDRIYIEVTFRGNKKMYYLVARGANININDYVIADIDKGSDIGRVSLAGMLAHLKEGSVEGHNIIRKANNVDLDKMEKLHKEEYTAFDTCDDRIAKYNLDMHLVEVEKQFDESKITFYFLAEQRVDFRELVKDLASTFKTRIELRQIGVRDEAKRVGGIGVCGLPFCCAVHLKAFEQISTQMARSQHLSINQSKLSGSCGRLKCCLRYELDYYEEMNTILPDIGTNVETPKGNATVIGVNVLKNTIKVQYPETGSEEFISPPETKK
jgi:cell fate regulator YaaT (PSP1 superfamily)